MFVTGSADQLPAAHELLLGTMVVRPTRDELTIRRRIHENTPDFLLESIKEVEEVLVGQRIGYIGECNAYRRNAAVIQPMPQPSSAGLYIPNARFPTTPIIACGRYYDFNDPRHDIHPLSIRILDAKRNPNRHAVFFATIFENVISALAGESCIVTRVPPRPNNADRFASILNQLDRLAQQKGADITIDPGLIKCISDYQTMKSIRRASDRGAAVQGVFSITSPVFGKTIVVLDDICTTASTLNEITRQLLAAGAQRVIPLVAGYHPFAISTNSSDLPPHNNCRCGAPWRPRCANSGGEPFFGCSAFSPGGNHNASDLLTERLSRLRNIEPHLLRLDERSDIRF